MTTGYKLVTDFKDKLNKYCKISKTDISQNVFEIKLKSSVLLYIKGRSSQPHKWGITANVISRLKQQEKPWYVVLLFNTINTGYLLSSHDTLNYIGDNVWPLGADGDYKPAKGLYLSHSIPFSTIKECIVRIGCNE